MQVLDQVSFDLIVSLIGIVTLVTATTVVIKRNQFVNWYIAVFFSIVGSIVYYFQNFNENIRYVADLMYLIGIILIYTVTIFDYQKYVKKQPISDFYRFFFRIIGSILILLILPLSIFLFEFGNILNYFLLSFSFILVVANFIYIRILTKDYSVTKLFFEFVIFDSFLSSFTTLVYNLTNIQFFYTLSYISIILAITFIIAVSLTVLFEDQLTFAEFMRKEKEILLDTFIELSPVGVILMQKEKIILVNTALSKITGYSKVEMKKWSTQDIVRFFSGKDREIVDTMIRRASELEIFDISEGPLEFKDRYDNRKWIEVFLKTSVYQNNFSNFLLIIDVTEKVEIENKFKLAFLNSPYPIVLVDGPSKKFMLFNDQFKDLFGYNEEELFEMTFFDLTPTQDMQDQDKITNNFRITEQDSFEIKTSKNYMKKSGDIFEAIVTSSLIKQGENNFSFITQILDLTYLKDLEYYKKILKQLEDTNEELETLNQVVSHDIKAPIIAVQNLLSLIEVEFADQLSDEVKMVFDRLNTKINFTSNLIKGILEYSSLGYKDEENEIVNINELVIEICEILQLPKNFTLSVSPDIPNVYMSKIRIQQVFQNLISNSIKFNDKKEGKISIEAQKLSNGNYEFSVEDNGCGISETDLPNVFKIFKTFRNSPQDTGLGLAIVKKIITLFGGDLSVSSILGKQTIFKFSLPEKFIISQK